MSESPEQIRERIHAEELAKGSDPRVAEARGKAAEMRARHGLPIDPQEAWRAKLAKEGGAPSAAAPTPPPSVASEEAAPAEAEPDEVPAAAGAPSPEPQPPTEPAPAAAPQPAALALEPPAPEPEPEVPFDPEIGDLIVIDQSVSVIGGVKVRDAPLPAWLMLILLAIPLWAMLYLLALGGDDVARRTSECVIQPDRTFVCFQPAEEPSSGSGGH